MICQLQSGPIGLFIFLFLGFHTFCFSQTNIQKREIYKGVKKFGGSSRSVSLVNHGLGEVDSLMFFSESTILPVFKYNSENKEGKQIPSLFVILFKDRLFVYNEDRTGNHSPVSLAFNNPEIANTIAYIKKYKESLRIGYLFDNYHEKVSRNDLFYTNPGNRTILYKGMVLSSLDDLIINTFGSMDKYKELAALDDTREKLTVHDINEAIKNNYRNYVNRCKGDTLLVVNVLISQINTAIGRELEKKRSAILKERILKKLKPVNFIINKLSEEMREQYNKQLKEEKEKKDNKRERDYYGFTVYNTNITGSLAAVLTKDELIKYMEYKDLYYPYSESYNSRLTYGKRILEKKGVIESNHAGAFSDYVEKIITTQGYQCLN